MIIITCDSHLCPQVTCRPKMGRLPLLQCPRQHWDSGRSKVRMRPWAWIGTKKIISTPSQTKNKPFAVVADGSATMSATMSALLPLAACLLLMWAGSCSAHSLFTCEPIRVHRCLGMSYNMTFFPNMMDHYDQDVAAALMEVRTACCWLRFRRVLYLYLCTYIYLIFFFLFKQGGTAFSTVSNHNKGCFSMWSLRGFVQFVWSLDGRTRLKVCSVKRCLCFSPGWQ